MKNEVVHWFDLDYTLWKTSAKWWVVDKQNPGRSILKIEQKEINEILSGKYINDNLPISYNGYAGYISNDLLLKIKQKKNIEQSNIGISFREYSENNYIEVQLKDLVVYLYNIIHLKGHRDVVNLLTARSNKEGHKKLLESLIDTLNTNDININDIVFVNDKNDLKLSTKTSEKKIIFLIESIVGYKISNYVFEPIRCDRYDVCNFYDDEITNIEEAKYIKDYISKYLENTIPWLKQKIQESLKSRKIDFIINEVTTNELNPFIKHKIELYNIVV